MQPDECRSESPAPAGSDARSASVDPVPGSFPIVEVRTTFGGLPEAEACARMLVAERLAACVQIDGPIRSTYRWQDRVETADEWRVTCKTVDALAAAVSEAIVRTHPYEQPEILRITVEAPHGYAAWVHESVAACPPPRGGVEAT